MLQVKTAGQHENIHVSGLLAGSKLVLGHSDREISADAPKRTFLFQLWKAGNEISWTHTWDSGASCKPACKKRQNPSISRRSVPIPDQIRAFIITIIIGKLKSANTTLRNSALAEEKRPTNILEDNTWYRGNRSFWEARTAPPTGGRRTAWTYQTCPSGTGDCPATAAAFDGGGDACGHNLAGWGRYRTPQGQRHWRGLSRVSLCKCWVAGPKGEEEGPGGEKPGDKVCRVSFYFTACSFKNMRHK